MKQTVSRAFVALVLVSAIARPAGAANKEQQQMMAAPQNEFSLCR